MTGTAAAPQPVFIRKIYEFIDVLRDADVAVSAEEVLSVFSALHHVSIMEKTSFRQALRTTLIKDFTDIPVFDRCFSQFFEPAGTDTEAAAQVIDELRRFTAGDEGLTAGDLQDLEGMIQEFIDGLPQQLLFQRTPEELMRLFLDQIEVSGGSGGLGMLLFNTRRQFTQGGHGAPAADEIPPEAPDLRALLLSLTREQVDRHRIGTQLKQREEYLLTKPIYRITPQEIREMRELIRRFGQKLKNRISLRKKRVRHGGFDVKRTLRRSLQYGGVPFRIYHKDRKIDRPQLVVLCDISGSVNQYSRFMLLLTYTLQGLFSKVRSFAFISNMVEITPLFREMDPERALNSIFQDNEFTYGWGSNYGRCFDIFVRDFSDALTSKTTVLVLGDGRNNYQDPGLASFLKIKERSRNLFWLNPDRKHLWAWSDSAAHIYREYCDEMKEVNSFLDLSEFIDRLFQDR